jgi:putative DNA primase/helicase
MEDETEGDEPRGAWSVACEAQPVSADGTPKDAADTTDAKYAMANDNAAVVDAIGVACEIETATAYRPPESVTAPALPVLTCAELLQLVLPPRRYLLEPWFPERGLAMVYAPRGVGKTLFALGMAYAVASGGTFLHFRAHEPRRVLYVDGEMPIEVMQERLTAIEQGSDYKVTDDHLRFLCADRLDVPMPDLGTPEGRRTLAPLVENAELIIIDNISTLVRTGRENESEAWQPIQQWALDQRRAGRSVLFVHHTNKTGAQRGTSKREDVLDTILSLSRPDDYDAAEGARFVLTIEKARGFFGPEAEPLNVRYRVTERGAVWDVSDVVDAQFEEAAALFAAGDSVRKVGDQLGISKSAAHRYRQRWLTAKA